MSAAERSSPSYVAIWVWLIGLLMAGLGAAFLPIGRVVVIALIFSIALTKAFLVVRHYMHLKNETLLIHAIAGIPVLLVIGMTLMLMPDIIFNR